MKKFYRLNILIFTAAVIALVFSFSAFNTGENQEQTVVTDKNHANKVAELVSQKKTGYNFKDVRLFTPSIGDNNTSLLVTQASYMGIDKSALQEINSSKPENINFIIKDPDGIEMTVELVKIKLIPDDFKIKLSSGLIEDYKGGLYYQGIIRGDNSSVATLSIFKDNVIGVFSTNEGTYNLGALKNQDKSNSNEYIFYNDRDITKKQSFICGVGDSYDSKYYRHREKNSITPTPSTSLTTSPVRMYYVCDYQMFLDFGSNPQNVADYVTAAFVQMRTLYFNEALNMELAPMFVYNVADPYRNIPTSQTAQILEAFGTETQNDFDGDLAQLLSTRTPITGAIAWVNVLCQSYEPTSQSGRYAFCEIETTFEIVPLFSWTIEVMAHETGHNYGSMHTQSCVWPVFQSGLGAIDSCVPAENGTCFIDTSVIFNGTIMSYCHIYGAINLALGFGPLPGDTIRAGYHNALCLDSALNSSEQPLSFNLMQNYPNPFNPGTRIQFELPQEGFVTLKMYDLLGREIATLINNNHYPIGIFSYNLDASSYNLASGVYLYKLDVSRDNKPLYSQIKKMVLVK